MGSKNVFFVDSNDKKNISDAFFKCLSDITNEDSILIDEFIDSRMPLNKENLKLGNRFRVYVTRCCNENVSVTGILCNIGPINSSISGASSNCFSLEYFCSIYGFSNDIKNKLEEKIIVAGVRTMESILEAEKNIDMDTINSQTDFIGLDLVLNKTENEDFKFYLIEVNDHESISAFANHEIINYPRQSKMLNKWINMMIKRSYDYLLSNKKILIIDIYGFKEYKLLDFFKMYKIEFIIIHRELVCSTGEFNKFIYNYNYKDNNVNNLEHAKKISEMITNMKFKPDCIITFNKDYLNLADNVKELIFNVNIKSTSREFTVYRNINYTYDIKTFHINTVNDFIDEYPILIKNINGKKSHHIINSREDLLLFLNKNKNSSGECLLKMQSFIIGTIYKVVLIIYEENLIFLKVFNPENNTQNIDDVEKYNNIRYSAVDCCLKKGFQTGIFFLKLIYSIQGIKLLQLESFIEASFNYKKYFDKCNINFLEYFLIINCGLKPFQIQDL